MASSDFPSPASSELTLPSGQGGSHPSPSEFIERRDIRKEDYVIIVVGICGAGRSTLIAHLSGMDPAVLVGHSLAAHTTTPGYIRFLNPDITYRPIVLIDTPGYDSDLKYSSAGYDPVPWQNILPIVESHQPPIVIQGIVYVQRVSDMINGQDRLSASALVPHPTLEDSVRSSLPQRKLVILTTHWDATFHKDPVICEAELKRTNWWMDLEKYGAVTRRFGNGIDATSLPAAAGHGGEDAARTAGLRRSTPQDDNTQAPPSLPTPSGPEQAKEIARLFFDEKWWKKVSDVVEGRASHNSKTEKTPGQRGVKSSPGMGFWARLLRGLVCA